MQRRVVTGSGVPTSASCNHSLMTDRVVYRSLMSDNSRWDALKLREGDIVISAPSKCGMTLTQRLVALLVFDGPDLPGPMSTMSPWLDQTIRAIGEVVATLGAQKHRRFIKTHTPLDGLVLDDRVTYIGVGRDPRDAAMSMIFQSANMDPARMRALHDAAAPHHPHSTEMPPPPAPGLPHLGGGPPHSSAGPPPHEPSAPPGADLSPLDEFHHWMEAPITPPEGMGSLATILHHFGSLWHCRHLPNVAIFHYADYQQDLGGELERLSGILGYELGHDRAKELAKHASLSAMRSRASEFAPNATDGLWRSDERFFRTGGRGEWRQIFTEREHRRYDARCAELAPRDLIDWSHKGREGQDPDTPPLVGPRFRKPWSRRA